LALAVANTQANKCANPSNALVSALCDDKSGTLIALESDVASLAASGAQEKRRAIEAFERSRDLCLAGAPDQKTNCLAQIYRTRRGGLLAKASPMKWMKRAQYILFASTDLAFAPDATLKPSWPGIVQTLARLSPSYLLAHIESGKRVIVRGAATDGGTAACSIDVSTTPANAGSFNARQMLSGNRRLKSIPLFRVVGEQAVLATEQDEGTTSSRVPVCDGKAPFGVMRRLPIDEGTFNILWASTNLVTPPEILVTAPFVR
jgi:hypothetical protein